VRCAKARGWPNAQQNPQIRNLFFTKASRLPCRYASNKRNTQDLNDLMEANPNG